MLVECSGNRQTFQNIWTGSPNPAGDVSGYSVCAKPLGTRTSFRSGIRAAAYR